MTHSNQGTPLKHETNEPVSHESHKVMTPEPNATLIDMGPVSHVIPEDQEPTSLDPHDELLRWHYHWPRPFRLLVTR